MKSAIIIFFILIFSTISHANDLSKKITETASNYISNLIPGEGTTEVSIDLRENYKPDFSILGVREVKKKDSGNIFTQFSLFSTEQNNKERYVGNLGIGSRWLSDDKTLLSGVNSFLDYDHEGNTRVSLGGELRNAVLELTSNYYLGIDNGGDGEKVLDGYEAQLSSQIPYIHWGDIFYSSYKWKGIDREDIEGTKYGADLSLNPHLNLEVAFDDKDLNGLKDEWYAKIIYSHPPKEGPTALDGISNSIWKDQKDMSGELLAKVKRQNKIMIEFKGSGTISRLD
jgi:hypothetical protein|tara:strand:+ start:139 stop:990 length:852 start_codon:yes stop_codon:yes gene_type:complete